MRRIAALSAALLVGGGVWSVRGQGQLTFRVEVNYVEIDAVVTDKQGHFVRGLTRDDFTIAEEKRPQDISTFSLIDIPVERAEAPLYRPAAAIEPDVVTNQKPFDGRVYLIVLDALHVDPTRTTQTRKYAREFIEKYFGANDLGAVVQIGNPAAGQEFTANKRLLIDSINKFIGSKLRSATLEWMDVINFNLGGRQGDPPPDDPLARPRAAQAEQAMESVRRLTEYIGGLRGRRKALLFFSEGIDYNVNQTFGSARGGAPATPRDTQTWAQSVLDAEQEMMAAAQRGNVSLYTIDPRGVTSGDDLLIQVSGQVPRSETDPAADALRRLLDETRNGQGTLRTFADQTGGLAAVNTNDFAGAFKTIVEDNSTYYVLGYYSTNTRKDGKYRSVDVKLKRSDLQIRARKGYYAATAKADAQSELIRAASGAGLSQPVHDLLVSPTPTSGLGMRVSAQPVMTSGDKALVHLSIEFNGQDLGFEQNAGAFTNEVEIAYEAIDQGGKAQAVSKDLAKLNLRPATKDLMVEHGLRYSTELQLAKGRYQVRVAAREQVSGHNGSVFLDLEVPDFSKPLVMGGVLIASSRAGQTPSTRNDPVVKALMPGSPTAVRDFAANEIISAFVEVLDNDTEHPHDVDLSAVVRSEDGRIKYKREEPRPAIELVSLGRGFLVRFPLAGFDPGRYVLTMTATSRIGEHLAVQREIEFRVK